MKDLISLVEHLYKYETPYFTMENEKYKIHYNKLNQDRAIFYVTIKEHSFQLCLTKELEQENKYIIIEQE